MNLNDLTLMDAPPKLLAWFESQLLAPGESIDDIVERELSAREAVGRLDDATYYPWLIAADELPLRGLVQLYGELTAAVADELGVSTPGVTAALGAAQKAVQGGSQSQECDAAADRLEIEAEHPPQAYRTSGTEVYSGIATSSAWVARAAGAVVDARARVSSGRLMSAQRTAAILGAGADILVGKDRAIVLTPWRIPDDPLQAELLFIPAALEQAAAAIVGVYQQGGRDDAERAAQGRQAAERYRGVLERLWGE